MWMEHKSTSDTYLAVIRIQSNVSETRAVDETCHSLQLMVKEEKRKKKNHQKILISLVIGLSKGYMKKDFTSSPPRSLFLFLLPYQSLHISFGTIRVVMCLGFKRMQPVSKINMERGSQMSKHWAKWCCRLWEMITAIWRIPTPITSRWISKCFRCKLSSSTVTYVFSLIPTTSSFTKSNTKGNHFLNQRETYTPQLQLQQDIVTKLIWLLTFLNYVIHNSSSEIILGDLWSTPKVRVLWYTFTLQKNVVKSLISIWYCSHG